MHVSAIIKRKGGEVVRVQASDSVEYAAAVLVHHRIGAVLVASAPEGREGGSSPPAGILSERDIVRGLAVSGAGILSDPVSALMTRDLIACTPDHTTGQLMTLMTERRVRHLPVIVEGEVLGMISIGDVVKACLDEGEVAVDSMRKMAADVR